MKSQSLKQRTADSLKWNLIDRFGTQILYAITGVVLARILSPESFGLVGAIVVFQAFASLLIDSGFMPALLQRKDPEDRDYHSIFWFNLSVSIVLYIILFFCAPLIANWYNRSEELIPLSRILFLSFIINGLSLVPNNRLLKKMNVRPVAIANSAGLIAGAATGILLALKGYGAWSLVYQTLVLGLVKGVLLWISDKWIPRFVFSFKALSSYFKFGGSMMVSSFLNTLFLNIYSFVIGNRIGIVPLGYYTQGDKWSKMGIMSLSQVFQTSLLPTLSEVQEERSRFLRLSLKINRFVAYVSLPSMIFPVAMSESIFHALFGAKWDDAIPLFQLLLIRGVFYLLTQGYNTVITASGKSRLIVITEILRDSTALIALVLTFPFLPYGYNNFLFGLEILIIGQIAASIVAWGYTMKKCSEVLGCGLLSVFKTCLTPVSVALFSVIPMIPIGWIDMNPWFIMILQAFAGFFFYWFLTRIVGSDIQESITERFFNHKRNRNRG